MPRTVNARFAIQGWDETPYGEGPVIEHFRRSP